MSSSSLEFPSAKIILLKRFCEYLMQFCSLAVVPQIIRVIHFPAWYNPSYPGIAPAVAILYTILTLTLTLTRGLILDNANLSTNVISYSQTCQLTHLYDPFAGSKPTQETIYSESTLFVQKRLFPGARTVKNH